MAKGTRRSSETPAPQVVWTPAPRTVIAHLEGDPSGNDVPYDKLGQLIVLHNMLEVGLSMLLSAVAGVHGHGMSFPIISALDYNRKCELLKGFAGQFPNEKARIRKIADLAEKIGKGRNDAAHGVIGKTKEQGWVVHRMAGAKLLSQGKAAPLLTVQELVDLSTAAADLIERMEALRTEFEAAHAAVQSRNDQLTEIIRTAVTKAQAEARAPD
ncbi:hypothetical protein [Caulobacter segnis]|uniref:hypothetical protein n=1 Tax=Caulobacter segnis TaxID=88688 RepID=UPI002857A2C5|nr:hypothetical protein [Caulobacter segnis]MDR6624851.1 hypothetical protein [Caulobacter segnis]